jgi:hypothetical protein
MKKYYNKYVMKETLLIVGSGTVINYPIGILFAWLIIDIWGITDPVAFATISTIGFFIVAMIRVYTVRYISETKRKD